MMDPALLSDANALLKAHGLKPRKRWGQNFLCDRNVLDRILKAARLDPVDHVLEIGAGLGTLTRSLADLSLKVTSVEIDPLLIPILGETLAEKTNVNLIHSDFLALDHAAVFAEAFPNGPGVVVANIPYYITSPILEVLFKHKRFFRRIVILAQREFANRMAAAPGTSDYGSMSVFAQFHSRIELVGTVSRNVFLPPPDIESAIVGLDLIHEGAVEVQDEDQYFRLVRGAFMERRKTLANAMVFAKVAADRETAVRVLEAAGIDPQRRGETLSLQEFANASDALSSYV